jgi:hypothetical protein
MRSSTTAPKYLIVALISQGSDALVVGADAVLNSRHETFVALSHRYSVPAMSVRREFAARPAARLVDGSYWHKADIPARSLDGRYWG